MAPYTLMGILNVTPDSFSDGGRFLEPRDALEQAALLAGEGAGILDVGGESTRPGAEPVRADEELRRTVPVLEAVAQAGLGVGLSIDTTKAVVARAAIEAGAGLVNDVSALRADPEMASVVASSGVECCLMHMLGEPRTMQLEPRYEGDVVDEVKAFLDERLRFAVAAGITEERIILDPGIGFGKTLAHNLALLDRLDELCSLGRPIMVGTSRKRFLGVLGARAHGLSEPLEAGRRLPGTLATSVLALERGASIFRVHEVAPVAEALAVATATLGGDGG
ncbi:MAG TPA: dihydropteroate synthase [Solirubrobacteraceae bacterium]|nr:dihydropteroate synthase [Solirubrobacteraceae bacterium]